ELLDLKEIFDVAAVGLVSSDHDRAGRILAAVGGKGRVAHADLDARGEKHIDEPSDGGRVAVVRWKQPGVRPSVAISINVALGGFQRITKPELWLTIDAGQ